MSQKEIDFFLKIVKLKTIVFGCFLLHNVNSLNIISEPPVISICGQEKELKLSGSGFESSLILTLSSDKPSSGPCIVQVSAPNTHIVHVTMTEDEGDEGIRMNDEQDEETSCVLNVYLPENKKSAVWRTNPCHSDNFPEGSLLTHQLQIVWKPPNLSDAYTNSRKLILTALGQGDVCHLKNQHACMRVGWSPLMCVADELLCDGISHCPSGASASDEDPQLCSTRKVLSWEKIAVNFFKKFTGKTKNGALIPAIHAGDETRWFFGKDGFFTTTKKTPANNKESDVQPGKSSSSLENFAAALSHYGPWGYLMLGMLVCGTVLMFCGLWECCCRKSKPTSESPQASQPTTVLIINNSQDTLDAQLPPSYEDLDQPPSYSALFPGKNVTVVANNSSRPNEN